MKGEVDKARLRALYEQIKVCSKCARLVKSRNQATIGYGNATIPVMFVGLNPAKEGHSKSSIPFRDVQGKSIRSGIPFLKALHYVGWNLEDIYFTELTKCHAPNNNPTELEIKNCKPYLIEEVTLVKPQIIVALGEIVERELTNRQSLKEIPILGIPHPSYIQRFKKGKIRDYFLRFAQIKEMIQARVYPN